MIRTRADLEHYMPEVSGILEHFASLGLHGTLLDGHDETTGYSLGDTRE